MEASPSGRHKSIGPSGFPSTSHARIACDVGTTRSGSPGASRRHARRARECTDAPRVDPIVATPDPALVARVAVVARGRTTTARAGRGQPLGRACVRRVARLCRANALLVACAFRSQHLFDNRHPNYAGDVGIGPIPG
jgi:hypothetical protein